MSGQGPLALILAGGASRRMGQSKALLSIRGRTWLEQAWTVCVEAFGADAPIYGSVAAGSELSNFSRNSEPSLRLVPDAPEFSGLGPLAGVASFCRFLVERGEFDENRILLVVPVDMPLLEAGDLRSLVEALEQDAGLGAAHFEGTVLPCAVRLQSDESAQLESRMRFRDGRRSVKDWLAFRRARDLPSHVRLRNFNTPEELSGIEGDVQ